MKASVRPYRIAIEQRTSVDDGYGGEQDGWEQVGEAYAAVYYGSGSEQREAAQKGGSQSASFEVLSNSLTRSLTVADFRLSYGGGLWDISAVHDIGLNDGIRITAVRQKP